MASFMMIYTSMTGNTKAMAEAIAAGIREAGYAVEMLDAFEADPSFLDDCDGFLIGTYTWGGGELPDDFLDFYEELDAVVLSGKKALVFGSFDSSYGDNGIAVDIMIEKLQERGAEIFHNGYKVELRPSPEQLAECKRLGYLFARSIVKKMEQWS